MNMLGFQAFLLSELISGSKDTNERQFASDSMMKGKKSSQEV